MAYDSAATRARLLDAAYDEFVEVGFAGARVDRIASTATANKQAIYAYFGSKEALFDAVLESRLTVLADAVPFTEDDLPGYAGALFDNLTAEPGLQRLTQWKLLERPDASPSEKQAHRAKAAAIAERYRTTPEHGMDTMMIMLGVIQAWLITPPGIRGPHDEGDEGTRLPAHRAAVVAAVGAVVRDLLEQPAHPRSGS